MFFNATFPNLACPSLCSWRSVLYRFFFFLHVLLRVIERAMVILWNIWAIYILVIGISTHTTRPWHVCFLLLLAAYARSVQNQDDAWATCRQAHTPHSLKMTGPTVFRSERSPWSACVCAGRKTIWHSAKIWTWNSFTLFLGTSSCAIKLANAPLKYETFFFICERYITGFLKLRRP